MAISGGKTLQVFVTADLKKFNSGLNQAQGGLKGFAGTMKSMVGPALIATAAAAGALAVKFGVDGVKAAMDDEAALKKLEATLTNVGLAHDQPKVEEFISGLERSLGIADDELRPAYDRLVRSIGDTEEANEALSLALDVSAGSGKSLDSVVQALGRGYDGNTQGLSRLGAGISKATLATGDMDIISKSLATTFSGQAATSADTLQGRMKVLKTATDNLGEAFGKGLLTGLTDATEGTDDMVKSMEELEPALESVGAALAVGGTAAAGFGAKAVGAATSITGFIRGLQNSQNPMIRTLALFNPLGAASFVLGDGLDAATKSTVDLANAQKVSVAGIPYYLGGFRDIIVAAGQMGDALRAANGQQAGLLTMGQATAGSRYTALAKSIKEAKEEVVDYGNSSGSASVEVEKLTKKQQKLLDTNEALGLRFAATNADLDLQKKKLEDAAQSVTDYADNIQKNLLGGIDLEEAFTGQFDALGNATGVSLLEGFNKQIDQANAFGNVLVKIRDAGGDSEFINAIASLGPVTGTALATQLIDDGLVPTMSDKFVDVRKSTAVLAMSIVPDFMLAGVAAGEETVNGLATQLSKEGDRLKKIGKQIAKPVGAAFKAKLEQDVAAALRDAEAFGTAARAEVSARESERQLGITQQQVALALSNLVRQADSRSGAVVTPVLA